MTYENDEREPSFTQEDIRDNSVEAEEGGREGGREGKRTLIFDGRPPLVFIWR